MTFTPRREVRLTLTIHDGAGRVDPEEVLRDVVAGLRTSGWERWSTGERHHVKRYTTVHTYILTLIRTLNNLPPKRPAPPRRPTGIRRSAARATPAQPFSGEPGDERDEGAIGPYSGPSSTPVRPYYGRIPKRGGR